MTAKWPAAYANATHDLRLVANADLTKLDPGLEHAGEVLYELAEVDPSVGGEIKQDLVVVEGIFRIDELHFQPMLLDLLEADLKSLFFLLFVACLLLLIALICDAENGL